MPKAKLLLIQINCIFLVLFLWIQNVLQAQENPLKFHHITVDEGLSQNTIHGIVRDKYGFMWFGTWEGISRYDGYKFDTFRANEMDPNSLPNNRINYLFADSNQNIWISAGENEICCYNYDTENFTRIRKEKVPSYIIKNLSRNSYSRKNVRNNRFMWQIKNSTLLQTDITNSKQICYTKDPFDEWSINDNMLTDLYIDKNGILWLGTENGGINCADTHAKPFENYSYSPVSKNSLIDNVIRAICKDQKGNIWIGTQSKGITLFNPNQPVYKHIEKNKLNSNTIISNEIRSLYADDNGFVWIGTKDGLTRYDTKTGQCKNYTSKGTNKIPNDWVFYIMEDHNKHLWIATFNGIAKYNRKDEQFYAYNPDLFLKSKKVRVILEDHKYNFWIATEGGGISLVKRDSANGFHEKLTPIKYYISSSSKKNLLENSTVLAMTEDENGILWVGTNNGLYQITPATLQVNKINLTGFPDNLIMGIVSDYHGFIWVSHKKGLTQINIKNLNYRNFTKADGLQSNEFNQNAYYRDSQSGRVYFGGISGLTAFFPNQIKDNPFYPQILITSLQINNKPVTVHQKIQGRIILEKSLLLTKNIELVYSCNNFTIGFTALHYSNPVENKYQYQLEGYDKNWINSTAAQRSASYSDISSGIYTFKVRAANPDGVWNPLPATLIIKILPPWWRSFWAISIYIIIMASGIFIYWRKQLKEAAQKGAHLQPTTEQSEIQLSKANSENHIQENTVNNASDEQLINKAKSIIIENITDTDFNTEKLSQKLNISQRHLYRKIKSSTNKTVHDFITDIRLEVAAELLLSGNLTISEVAYKVGYSEPANFTRTFTKKFGKNPSTYIHELKKS
jgi:ligand-binding sensor domain-containing protein/AraC-like DNA-binding protein